MNADDESIDADLPLCMHCAKPYNGLDHFCPHCAGPVSQHSAVDPMGQIYAMGHAYSSATSGRASKRVLLGMWLLFGPQFVLLLVVDVWVAARIVVPTDQMGPFDQGVRIDVGSVTEAFFKFGTMIALTVFYGIMLYKVTAGYLRKQKEREARSIEDD